MYYLKFEIGVCLHLAKLLRIKKFEIQKSEKIQCDYEIPDNHKGSSNSVSLYLFEQSTRMNRKTVSLLENIQHQDEIEHLKWKYSAKVLNRLFFYISFALLNCRVCLVLD